MKSDLGSLWEELAGRHRRDPSKPPPSRFQLFNRTADDLAGRLARDASERSALPGAHQEGAHSFTALVSRPACDQCGAEDLEHFYTCRRTRRTLCARCFQIQADE